MADYATLLRDHTTLTCRCIDRIFLQAYMRSLQTEGQVCGFLTRQRGARVPSSAVFGKMGERYIKEIQDWAAANGVEVYAFKKGENKEKLVKPLFDAAAKEGGDGRVVLIGVAQEKANAWRSRKGENQGNTARPHMVWSRQKVFINHYYFYIWDRQWGKTFFKTNAYAPYPIWLYLNGHEWAKRQLEQEGIAYEALDNGFRSCQDPKRLQVICDSLGEDDVRRFFWRWFWQLPSPLTEADIDAGYGYEFAFRQFEVSDTRVFDQPQSGRAFFEALIRDHLDLGRPSKVSLIFDRKVISTTPGTFATKVITDGVDPEISCSYKKSRIKQYFKEHCALRTETVINDTKNFEIGRSLTAENWRKLRCVGENANQRLCDAQAIDAAPAPDAATITLVTRRSVTADNLPASGLPFGDLRVMAVLVALLQFRHIFAGFRNPDLVALVAAMLNTPYTSRQATYDLRRLRRKGIIERTPRTNRYQVTPFGRRIAVLMTKEHARFMAPALPLLDAALPAEIRACSPLAEAWYHFDRELDRYIETQRIPAA